MHVWERPIDGMGFILQQIVSHTSDIDRIDVVLSIVVLSTVSYNCSVFACSYFGFENVEIILWGGRGGKATSGEGSEAVRDSRIL